MLVATKYEEIYAPEVRDFVYITDNAYTSDEILEMEYRILKALDFDMTIVSPLRFVDCLVKKLNQDSLVQNFAYYLIELTLVESKLIKYKPSLLALTSIYIATKICKKQEESMNSIYDMRERIHVSESEVKTCAKDLCLLLKGSQKCSLQAV